MIVYLFAMFYSVWFVLPVCCLFCFKLLLVLCFCFLRLFHVLICY